MSSKHSEIVHDNYFHELFVLKIDLQLGKALMAKICKEGLVKI